MRGIPIGNPPHLIRYHLVPHNRWCNVFLHKIIGSDYLEHGTHDHPWNFLSLLVWGRYFEQLWVKRPVEHCGACFEWHTRNGKRRAPSIIYRDAECQHAIFLRSKVAWSVVITGPQIKPWGFYYTRNLWKKHTDALKDTARTEETKKWNR